MSAWTSATLLTLSVLGLSGQPAAGSAGYDYGDAPVDFDAASGDPARARVAGPRLGATVSADAVDPRTGSSTKAGESAEGDDDDGVAALAPVPVGRLTTVRFDVALSGVAEPARLCGWLDLDLDRTFNGGEGICAQVAAGATAAVLSWDARAEAAGTSFLRLRIATSAREAEQPDGSSTSGEVEDHPVAFVEEPRPPRPALSLDTEASPLRVSRVGEVIRYVYRLRNRGAVALRAVTLRDLRVPPEDLRCTPALGTTLAPGERLTCTAGVAVTQEDLDFGALETAAEARAEAPAGDPDDRSDDVLAVGAATVEAASRPRLAVAVTTAPGRPALGDRLAIGTTVTNVGNPTLDRIRLDHLRPRDAELACAPASPVTLAPGASLSCAGSVVLAVGDVSRGRLQVRVGARAEHPYGLPGSPSDDVVAAATALVPVRQPAPAPPHSSAPAPATSSPVVTRPAVARAASAGPSTVQASSPSLADSGGPGWATAVGGLLAVLGGSAALTRRSGRRR